MGVFVMLQMLSLVTSTSMVAIRAILAASCDAIKGFPLALVCIGSDGEDCVMMMMKMKS